MNQPTLLLIGAGGHALACIEAIERQARYAIAGLVGSPEQAGTRLLGYPVLGTDDDLPALRGSCANAVVAVGQIRSPDVRRRLFDLALKLGFDLPVIVADQAACLSRHAVVGAGTVVMPAASINAGARIGRNCIVNTAALIEHGVQVDDHCHISTGAILNGDVHIGEGTFVGSGSVVKEGVRIGRNCIIGMGLPVHGDLPDHARITRNGCTIGDDRP